MTHRRLSEVIGFDELEGRLRVRLRVIKEDREAARQLLLSMTHSDAPRQWRQLPFTAL